MTETKLPASLANMKWGDSGADSTDMLISKVILVQSGNPLIQQKKAALGDIIESIDGKILAKEGKSVEIIPLATYKNWRRYKMEGTKQTYIETLPYNAHTMNLQKEETTNDGSFKNVKCLNFFVLLTSEEYDLPMVVTFRGGSTYAGKKLSTHFSISDMKQKPPFTTAFALSTKPATFDGFNFYAYEVAKARDVTPGEMETAGMWFKKLTNAKANVEVDEASEE